MWNTHTTFTGKCRRKETRFVHGVLFFFQKDIRVSLIFSMLQQMLMEDKCDQVRSVCCKSLAMVINEIDDESRLSQVNHS